MKMIQTGLFRVCFQPITTLNCCTTCISWEIGSYNTQQSRHNEHTHFCRNFVAKSAIWFSENEGGGSNAVWNFSENSSVLVCAPVPNLKYIGPHFTTIGHMLDKRQEGRHISNSLPSSGSSNWIRLIFASIVSLFICQSYSAISGFSSEWSSGKWAVDDGQRIS